MFNAAARPWFTMLYDHVLRAASAWARAARESGLAPRCWATRGKGGFFSSDLSSDRWCTHVLCPWSHHSQNNQKNRTWVLPWAHLIVPCPLPPSKVAVVPLANRLLHTWARPSCPVMFDFDGLVRTWQRATNDYTGDCTTVARELAVCTANAGKGC